MLEKKVIKTAVYCIVLGIVLLVTGCCFGGFKAIYGNFNGFNFNIPDKKDMINERKTVASFKNINIDVDSADIEIEKGEEFEIETKYNKLFEEISYNVSDDVLYINGKRKNDVSFDITFIDDDAKIKIYIPEDCILSEMKSQLKAGNMSLKDMSFTNADITNSFGDISMDNINSNNINVSCNSGDMKFSNIDGDKFIVNSEYGSIEAENVKMGDLTSTLKSGDINLHNINCGNSNINNNCGDIKCDNIISNGLNIIDNCGEININGELRGKNEIDSEHGDVNLNTSLLEKDYSYKFDAELGDLNVDGREYGEGTEKADTSAANIINAYCKCGNLKVNFKK
ncbi:MAG: DUF4097 family beta strand repeat-containing protein [Clostridium sp.]